MLSLVRGSECCVTLCKLMMFQGFCCILIAVVTYNSFCETKFQTGLNWSLQMNNFSQCFTICTEFL